ncbi:MAG: Kazal-type serine protease inhibitor domain-containing protein [Methylococcales bacterium]
MCINNSAAQGLNTEADHATKTIFSLNCNDDSSCSTHEDCAKPVGVSGNGSGYCNSIPEGACPANNDPVCGRDNQTYSNACEAVLQGINVPYGGVCNP